MLGLWLTTIGALTIFFTVFYFFFLAIKSSVNIEDAYKVDRQPDEEQD